MSGPLGRLPGAAHNPKQLSRPNDRRLVVRDEFSVDSTT